MKIAIIGLGYVGLPLACLFSSKYPVIGYDINTERINDLRGGNDYTLEVKQEALKAILIEGTNEGKGLYPSNNLEDLHECNIYINLKNDLRKIDRIKKLYIFNYKKHYNIDQIVKKC